MCSLVVKQAASLMPSQTRETQLNEKYRNHKYERDAAQLEASPQESNAIASLEAEKAVRWAL